MIVTNKRILWLGKGLTLTAAIASASYYVIHTHQAANPPPPSMSPEVVEFEGFINYGTPIQTSNDVQGRPVTIMLGSKSIDQPVFSTRMLVDKEAESSGASPPAKPAIPPPAAQ